VNRLNKILAAALAVQLALAVFMLTRNRGEQVAELTAVAPGLDSAAVTKIAVFAKREKSATGDAKPALEVVKKGDDWVLATHFDYPADKTKVTELLSKIASLKSRGAIASSSARYAQLGVGDDAYERKVVLTTPKGDQTIFIGNAAGSRRVAMRRGGDAHVYAVTGLTAFGVEAEPRGWMDRTYTEIESDQVAEIVIHTPRGTFKLDHSTGNWVASENDAPLPVAAGEAFDPTRADEILTKVSKIEATAPADAKRDTANTAATVTVRMKPPAAAGEGSAAAASVSTPERVFDVLLDGDKYWVHERGNARAVLVDKWALEPVVNVGHDTLVKKAEPTPAGGGAMPPGMPPGMQLPPGMQMPPGMPPAPGAPKPAAPGAKPPAPPKPAKPAAPTPAPAAKPVAPAPPG